MKINTVARIKLGVYIVYLNLSSSNVCLMAKKEDESWMWHRRLGHASMHIIFKLCRNDLVVGLPKLSFDFDKVCDACVKGKHRKNSFKPKNCVSISKPLQLLHIDLFGPTKTMSPGGKQYGFVIVDDYTRYTWVLSCQQRMKPWICLFLFTKLFTMKRVIQFLALEVIMEKNLKILVL